MFYSGNSFREITQHCPAFPVCREKGESVKLMYLNSSMGASQYRDSLDSSLGSSLDLRKIIIKILMEQQGRKHPLTVLRCGTPAWERNSLGNDMEKSRFLGDTCPSPLQARPESLHRFLCHLSLPHYQKSCLALG